MKRKRRECVEIENGTFRMHENDFKVVDGMLKDHLKAIGSKPGYNYVCNFDDNNDNNDDEGKASDVCIRRDDDDDSAYDDYDDDDGDDNCNDDDEEEDDEDDSSTVISHSLNGVNLFNSFEIDDDKRVASLTIMESVRSLPKSLLRLDALVALGIESQRIEFPRWVREMKRLEEICIVLDNGNILPKGIKQFPNLKYLEVSGEVHASFPSSLGNLPSLKEMCVEGIYYIPDGIGNFTNLETLSIKYAESLPSSIGNLKNLKTLTIRNCSYFELPDEIGNLTSLESLEISHSGIKSIPCSIGNLKNLKLLDLRMAECLSGLPDDIGKLTNLEHLNLSGSGCDGILPACIGNLKNLKSLRLSQLDKMHSLPDRIGDLTKLELLDLSRSGIASFPNSFGNLASLRQLNLDSTDKLNALPDAIGNFPNLEVLLYCNWSSTPIPPAITNLKKLRILHLYDEEGAQLSLQLLSKLAEQNPQLGCLGNFPIHKHHAVRETLIWNRATTRLAGSTNAKDDWISSRLSLFPLILERANRVFAKYKECCGSCIRGYSQSSAIFQLLVNYGARVVATSRADSRCLPISDWSCTKKPAQVRKKPKKVPDSSESP
jgi:Leucine-rich repeat (LRR) protein